MKHLQDGDKEVTSLADIADTLAENFSEVSSSRHYNAKFQSHKERTDSMTNVRRHVPIERKPGEKSSLTPQTTIFNATKSSGPKAEEL